MNNCFHYYIIMIDFIINSFISIYLLVNSRINNITWMIINDSFELIWAINILRTYFNKSPANEAIII